jgi:hypothetical protein
MPTKIVTPDEAAQIQRDVDGEHAAFMEALDRRQTDRAIAADEQKFLEVGQYLPRHEKDAGLRAIRDKRRQEQAARENVAATRLGVLLNDLPDLHASRAHYEAALGIVPAFEKHTGRAGTSEQTYVSLLNLEATLTAQIEARLTGRTLTAVALDQWHETLVDGDPNEPRSNVGIRTIDDHRDNLAAIVEVFDPVRQPEHERALARLRQRISDTRAGRVPSAITAAITAIDEAKRVLDRQMRIRKLRLVSRHELNAMNEESA